MTTSKFRSAIMATAAIVLTPASAECKPWVREQISIKPSPVVLEDFLDLQFDPNSSAWKWNRKVDRYAMQTVEVNLYAGERIAVGYRGSVKLIGTLWLNDPSETGGERPGWKLVTDFGMTDAKPDKTHFSAFGFSGLKKSGHYQIQFWTETPETKGWAKIWLFRAKDAFPADQVDSDGSVERKLLDAAWLQASAHPLDLTATTADRRRIAPVPEVDRLPLPADGEAFVASAPDRLKPFYSALYAGGEHDAVLNFEKLGLAAMEVGDFAIAEHAFDNAIARIETIFGRSKTSAAARSKWASEAIKDFKGEPYERAMAYYYRGLLYLRIGDFDNAHAMFKSAEYQDTLSEAEEFQSDFALMDYLQGWSSRCSGESGNAVDEFAAARHIRSNLVQPEPKQRKLLIAELGQGPIKVRRGGADQFLSFADPKHRDSGAKAIFSQGARSLTPMTLAASISHQATTRGGRPIDVILNGKANFQNTTATTGGLFEALAGSIPVLAVPTLIFAAVAGKTQTEADIRMWDSLPDHIDLATSRALPSSATEFSFTDSSAATSGKPWMTGGDAHCSIVWTRDRSAIAEGAGVPGGDASAARKSARKDDEAARDAAFREAMNSHFAH